MTLTAFLVIAGVAEIVSNPLIVGIVVTSLAAVPAYLGYRLTKKKDERLAARMDEESGQVREVYEAQQKIIERLDREVAALKLEIAECVELKAAVDRINKQVNGD